MRSANRFRQRLAIVVSHPIQYYAPWFAYLAENLPGPIRIFYLWDFGVRRQLDRGFRCPVAWDVDLLAGYDSIFIKNIASDPGTHHFLGLNNSRLAREVAAWKPDVVLLFGYYSWSHLRLIFSRRLEGVPFIFRGDSHLLSPTAPRLRGIVKYVALRFLFRRFRAALCVGQANREYLLRFGFSSEAIFHAPHAVNNKSFKPGNRTESVPAVRQQFGVDLGDRLILFAGKFERKKRPDDLIAAFISARLPNASLLMVGGGEMEKELRRMAQGHPRIRFAPFQNQKAMGCLYAAADLFCLPSHAPDETWGMAVQESLCCGTPVIVSDQVGSHLDLVQSGWNGLVFPAGNRAELARSLCVALQDSERLAGWRANALVSVRRHTYPEATAGLESALFSLRHQNAKTSASRIHLWAPSLTGPGGIQQYSRVLARALRELLPAAAIRVVTKEGAFRAQKTSPRLFRSAREIVKQWHTLAFVIRLMQQVIFFRPNLVIVTHLHFARAAYLFRWTGLRYWVAVHGIEAQQSLSPLTRRALRSADRILPVSRHTQRIVHALKLGNDRCTILPNCVDGDRFYPQEKPASLLRLYGLGPTRKILFTLARLDSRERYKGHDLVLEALPRIRRIIPEVHYILSGRGNETKHLRQRVRDLDLNDCVTLTGFVPDQALRDHYNLCDIFLMPSRAEGFGIVFLEALACGKSVIAGNADGSRDPLADGAFGKLIDPSSVDELVDAVTKRLLAQPPSGADVQGLRTRVLQRFGFETFKANLASLLEN